MRLPENQLAELKHAHQVLNVPLSSSASSIKHAYRNLIKRWHPDHYRNGSPEYAEATQMTKLLNSAYSAIENAPLRYHVDACPPSSVQSRHVATSFSSQSNEIRSEKLPRTDWLEFSVRFVFGALLGGLLSIRVFLFYYDEPTVLIPVSIALIFGFGILSAKSGDSFWHSLLRRWWLWW
jgi:curved DNA-binding protein CbpA